MSVGAGVTAAADLEGRLHTSQIQVATRAIVVIKAVVAAVVGRTTTNQGKQ
jgi:hypothetical protein